MRSYVTNPATPGRLHEVEAPVPAGGPGIAIVRVLASSINRGELRLIDARRNGWAPGQDVAGVVAIPASAGGPPPGSRVVGIAEGGAWSEFAAVPLARLALLPAGVDDAQGACLGVAGVTALRAVRALGEVIGRTVLVTGATGGAGNVAVQLAVAAGALVTGLVRHRVAVDGVRIVAALGDERFHGAIDSVGGTVLTNVLEHLRPDARVVFFGAVDSSPTPFSLGSFRGSPGATVQPLFVYDAPGRFDEDLATLAAFVADGRLRPRIDRRLPFERVDEGLAALAGGAIDGKIVLVRAAS